MIARAGLILALTVGTAVAQAPENPFRTPQDGSESMFAPRTPSVSEEQRERVALAPRATLRALDKVTGEVRDIDMAVGETRAFGRLAVTLDECRYPEANPAGNAYVYLTIREAGQEAPDFHGWMVASAPALNPLDHPRYDVWAMRCNT